MTSITKQVKNALLLIMLPLLSMAALAGLPAGQSFAASLHKTPNADTTVTTAIRELLADNKPNLKIYFPESVKRFYRQRDFAPGWVNPQNRDQKTWESMMLLDCVLQYGLAHADYHPADIIYSRLHDILERPATVSSAGKAQYDILLTDAMITFINHLHFGKLNPDFPAKKIDRMTADFRADIILANALQQRDYTSAILDVQPKTKEYEDLQRRMHLLEGVYQGDCYEIPQAEIRKIAINMERLRWMNIDGGSYIHINIPSFTLKFHRPDMVYEFKIVAGKPATPTPVVTNSITYFTVGYKRRPGNMPGLRINKENEYQGNNTINNYTLRGTQPGAIFFWQANNKGITLLGLGKAKMPVNKAQAITDGTIKIENGRKLAALLLENDKTAARIKEMQTALNAGQMKNFMLQTPVPLRITYITCEMKDGVLVTYPDVYNKDKKLEMALYNTNQALTMR